MGDFEQKIQGKIQEELLRVKQKILVVREEELSEQQGGANNTPLTEEADVAQLLEGIEMRSERENGLFRRARALEEALRRVRRGSYGVCTSCEKPIARKRLEAIPEAALCAECQTRMETEESVIRRPLPSRPSEWGEAEAVTEDEGDSGG